MASPPPETQAWYAFQHGKSHGCTGPATATEPVHASANTAAAIAFLMARIDITP
jgi:hypothetical protein